MTETMIERVARAIYVTDGGNEDKWSALVSKPEYLDLARAAITAIREPTDMMWEALDYHITDVQWNNMIAAALSEKTE